MKVGVGGWVNASRLAFGVQRSVYAKFRSPPGILLKRQYHLINEEL